MPQSTDKNTASPYEDHALVLKLLKKDQEVETDRRDEVREVHDFLDQKDGQWDDYAAKAFKGRPRYTLDKCNDLVDDIAGPISQSDFDIQVLPAGGDSTEGLAKTYDGLIRNIQNLSNASDIYDASSTSVIRAGMDGWRVNQRWGNNNSFDQDLYIDVIADFVDRVWFDCSSVLQTREDANHCHVLTAMNKSKYEEDYPKGSGKSVSTDSTSSDDRTPEVIIVGEILYKVKVNRRIVELTNGSVYVDDDKFKKIQDELASSGATVKRERSRMMDEVKTRIYDGSGWLTPVQNTVFELIPVIPQYANWSIRRSVPNYWGIVSKKLDAQRIYNYTESRKVEEGALAPLAKILATKTQIGGNKSAWETLNTSGDPALPYDADPEAPPPYKIGGPDINPGLESTSQSMLSNLQSTAGLDPLNGQALGLQSGLAVELKQDRGDTRNYKYVRSKQIAVCHTGKILMKAIPKVYDTKRQVRIINEDTSVEMITLNDRVIDTETNEPVEVIDLSKGLYDVTCEVSKSFKNRQGETVNSITEVASIDPTIIDDGRDVLYKNMNAPGFDLLAERAREKMLLSGQIPESQMTDDEKKFLKEQPDPPPDPVAEALQREADNADDKIDLEGSKLVLEEQKLAAKIENDKRDDDRASMTEAFENIKVMAAALKDQAAAYKMLADAKGIEGIDVPGVDGLLVGQAATVRESQAEQP